MDEDTTTTPDVPADTGAEEAQPATPNDTDVADNQPESEPSEPSQDAPAEETSEQSAPQVDDKLQKYAKSQGLDLDSPSAIKAASIAMKAQSEATRNYQKASELEKATTTVSDEYAEAEAQQTGQDPELLKTVRSLQIKDKVRDFWSTPLPNGTLPDKGLEQSMIAELQAKPYLAGDLETLYASASFKSGTAETVKSQGKREALESLAHKQQAAVPKGNATNPSTTPPQKKFEEMSIAEMEAKLGKVRQ